MFRSMRLCSQIVGYFRHFGALHRPYLRAQPQYFIHLCARGPDEGKDAGIKMAWPCHSTRMYTGNPKGGKDGTCKPHATTKTVEEHLKCKDTDTSIQATRKESIENKSTNTPNQQPLKEYKPITPTPPQKSDNKTFAECKAPSSSAQTSVHKIIPSEQEHDRLRRTTNSPQQVYSLDTNGKQERYTRKLTGGVLLLLATVFAVYYAGFTVKKGTEEKPDEVKKTVRKSGKCTKEATMCVVDEDNENDGRK